MLGPGDRNGNIHYCCLDSAPALVWAANMAALEVHAPMARSDIETPTMCVFDLDPGDGTSIVECADVALDVRHVLDAVHTPTLVLHRRENGWWSVDGARWMAESMPRAEFVELDGVGFADAGDIRYRLVQQLMREGAKRGTVVREAVDEWTGGDERQNGVGNVDRDAVDERLELPLRQIELRHPRLQRLALRRQRNAAEDAVQLVAPDGQRPGGTGPRLQQVFRRRVQACRSVV